MSSTDERRLRQFFRTEVVPAAEALRARGARFFPTGPDDAPSWYVGPPETPPFVALDAEGCVAELAALWARQGLPELARVARGLGPLAARLQVREADVSEISPFVYVML